MTTAGRRRRRHWWAIAAQRPHGAKTYYTLNVAGKKDRPIVVTRTTREQRDDAWLCVDCVKVDCAHVAFVEDVVRVATADAGTDAALDERIRRMFAETPTHEKPLTLAGDWCGRAMKDVPREELYRAIAYHSNPKRAWSRRSQEIVRDVEETLRWMDAQRTTDDTAFPAALRDDDTPFPWEQGED